MNNLTPIDWPSIHKQKRKEYSDLAEQWKGTATGDNFRHLAQLHGANLAETSPVPTSPAPSDDVGYELRKALMELAIFVAVLVILILRLGIPR